MTIGVRVVTGVARTTTGTTDFTVSGFTAAFGAPKAAMFLACGDTDDTSDSVVADAILSVGFTDGTNSQCMSYFSDDGQATSDCSRLGANDEVIILGGTSQSIAGEAKFSAWITDGVRIDWDANAAPTASQIICILFGGSEMNAAVGTTTVNHASTASATPGFEADVVFCIQTGGNHTGQSTNANLGFGIAERRGTVKNNSFATASSDLRSTTDVASRGMATACSQNMNSSDGTLSRGASITSYTSTQFVFTHFDGNGDFSHTAAWLALEFGDNDYWTGWIAGPTATGDHAITDPGFKPQFALEVHTGRDAENEDPATSTGGGEATTQCWSVFDASTEACVGFTDEDNATTSSVSKSTARNEAVLAYDETAATIRRNATFSSFDTTGRTLNYSVNTGETNRILAFYVEEDAAGGGPSTAILRRRRDASLDAPLVIGAVAMNAWHTLRSTAAVTRREFVKRLAALGLRK